jgi:hypothetical protein
VAKFIIHIIENNADRFAPCPIYSLECYSVHLLGIGLGRAERWFASCGQKKHFCLYQDSNTNSPVVRPAVYHCADYSTLIIMK